MSKVPESYVVKTCQEWLSLHGVFQWRNNTGAMKTARGGFIRFGEVGSPDILAIKSPAGQFVGIECKATGGKQSEHQKQFEERLKASGGEYILVHPENVIKKMEEVFLA